MSRKATVTNGSFSRMYVVTGVNEKKKKSWLLNSASGELKCNAVQKKVLSFSDSFPAIILYFQVPLSSQISLGNYFLSISWKDPTLLQELLLSPHSHFSLQKQQVQVRISQTPVLLDAYPK